MNYPTTDFEKIGIVLPEHMEHALKESALHRLMPRVKATGFVDEHNIIVRGMVYRAVSPVGILALTHGKVGARKDEKDIQFTEADDRMMAGRIVEAMDKHFFGESNFSDSIVRPPTIGDIVANLATYEVDCEKVREDFYRAVVAALVPPSLPDMDFVVLPQPTDGEFVEEGALPASRIDRFAIRPAALNLAIHFPLLRHELPTLYDGKCYLLSPPPDSAKTVEKRAVYWMAYTYRVVNPHGILTCSDAYWGSAYFGP